MKMKILLFTILLFSAIALHAQNSIESYSIQVSFDKTVHIIFPSAIKYVDLGSGDIIAAKAPGAENVLRVKAAVEHFTDSTNISVICDDGTFYSFYVSYSDKLENLTIPILDEIYASQNGDVSIRQVEAIMQAIYKENRNNIKYLGCKLFSIQTLVKSIYVHEGLFLIHVLIKNSSNIPFDIDFVRFKITDKKLMKRTAMQEIYLEPLASYSEVKRVLAHSSVRVVYVFSKFTMANEKQFTIELYEKDGARNQVIRIENQDFENAKTIEKLKLK